MIQYNILGGTDDLSTTQPLQETKTIKPQYNLFFGGQISDYFIGKSNLYIGDKDFIFADSQIHLQAEIKTISECGNFKGKKLKLKQVREYASIVDTVDNYGRTIKCFLFEYHKYTSMPYVIVTPIIKPDVDVFGDDVTVDQFLDISKSKCLYLKTQFKEWLAGNSGLGIKTRFPLKCV